MVAWPEKTIEKEAERKEIVFKTKHVTGMDLSSTSKMLAIYNNEECEVSFWNYDLLKLYEVVTFDAPVTNVLMAEELSLVVVVTGEGSISLLKYTKTENSLGLEVVGEFCLQEMGSKNKNLQNCSLKIAKEGHCYALYFGSSRGALTKVDLTEILTTHFPGYKIPTPIKEPISIFRCQR